MNYTVYEHICPNGKVYIGITCKKPEQRWINGYGYIRNMHFTQAIKKYGWNNIQHKILFNNLSKEEACKKEIELIAKYKSNNRKYGYNLSTGGEKSSAGCIKSKESRKKLSIANKGKKRTKEQAAYIRKRCIEEKGAKIIYHNITNITKDKYNIRYEKITKYNSIVEAAKELGKHKNTIFKSLQIITKNKNKSYFEYENKKKIIDNIIKKYDKIEIMEQ